MTDIIEVTRMALSMDGDMEPDPNGDWVHVSDYDALQQEFARLRAGQKLAVADDVDLWTFLRDVLKRGASIESQFSQQGYEVFVAEIESAARSEKNRLLAMLAASPKPAEVADDVPETDANCAAMDRQYLAGLQAGWGLGVLNDREGYERVTAARRDDLALLAASQKVKP